MIRRIMIDVMRDSPPRVIRVVLCYPHALLRDILRTLLLPVADLLLVGEAPDVETTLALASSVQPDVALLGGFLGSSEHEHALRTLTTRCPTLRLLVLDTRSEDDRLGSTMAAGAHGYVSLEETADELVYAVRQVDGGSLYLGSRRNAPSMAARPTTLPHDAKERFGQLSDREQSVVRLVASGFSGVEIAARLGISTKTVDSYKHRVRRKLGFWHRRDYVRFALEAGVLEGQSPGA